MPLFPSLPDDALVADVYPMNPKLFRVWCEVEEGIMRWPSAFSPGEREMMGAFCSSLNACTYCASSHSEAVFVDGHGLPSDPTLFEERGRRHMEHGYVAQYATETAGDE